MKKSIKAIIKWFASIPKDKLLHYAVGLVIAATALLTFHLQWWIVLCIVTGLALAKDLYDLLDYGKFDWLDVLSSVLGGALIVGLYELGLLI